jgi:23S rRNA pseudouridine1911/1915/1917 synthase
MKSCFSLLPHISLNCFFKNQLGLSGQWIKRNSRFSKDLLTKKDDRPRTYDCELNLLNAGLINAQYLGPEITVIHEDHDLIVLNKPEKIHGHPLCYQEQDNVLSFLRSRNISSPLFVNPTTHERGLLYRLDFETSGVLILAKNQESFDRFFRQRMKKKLYFALVKAGLKESGEIRAYFKPFGKKGEKMKVHSSLIEGSVEGHTRVEILKQSEEFDLVALELYEGHRHQLRALMAFLGHPIMGDTQYGGTTHSRLMLHASQYIILDESREWDFIAPLEGEIKDFLNLHGLLQVFHDQFNIC